MARNKHPEETVEKILAVARRLFAQKGYENTSIQDIVDQLGGLSKGAIYHHFGSKEDIFDAVCRQLGEENTALYAYIRDDPGRNGREKLKAMLETACQNQNDHDFVSMVAQTVLDPRFLRTQFDEVISTVAPHYVQPVIEEGLHDGSLPRAIHPKELAQAISLLLNLWANPFFVPATGEEMQNRAQVLRRLFEGVGLDIIDDEMEATFFRHTARHLSGEEDRP